MRTTRSAPWAAHGRRVVRQTRTGVYAAGNVKLKPTILKDSQEFVKKARKTTSDEPLSFVFHGGSGSTPEEIAEAVSYGVVKMNIDTDTQWAFTDPVKKYMDEKGAYLKSQLGNPEGPEKPNKKHIDRACGCSSPRRA